VERPEKLCYRHTPTMQLLFRSENESRDNSRDPTTWYGLRTSTSSVILFGGLTKTRNRLPAAKKLEYVGMDGTGLYQGPSVRTLPSSTPHSERFHGSMTLRDPTQ
jgi:hypothetical protein